VAGGIRYRDGRVQDRRHRDEDTVREQMELAGEIVEMLAEIRERAPGRSVGPRLHRRLEVVQGSFRRLMERDSHILTEFEKYREREELLRRPARAEPRPMRSARQGSSTERGPKFKSRRHDDEKALLRGPFPVSRLRTRA